MFTGRNNRRRGCSGVAMQSTTLSPSTIIQKPDASKCSAYVMPKKYMTKHAAMNTKLVPSEIVPSKDMNPAAPRRLQKPNQAGIGCCISCKRLQVKGFEDDYH